MRNRKNIGQLLKVVGASLALGVGLGLAITPSVHAQTDKPAAAAEETQDVLVFKNGNVLKGTIVSETTDTIKFKTMAGGIAFETEYPKSDIVEVRRATKKAPDAAVATATTTSSSVASTTPSDKPAVETPAEGAKKVYIIPAHGIFGEDISETPIYDCVKDAKAQGASIIVIDLNAEALLNPRNGQPLDERLAWDLTSRVEQIFPVFTERLPKEWPVNPPRIVMVVHRAVGGAAFFPLAFKEVYFANDGIMGGIGTLSEMFSGVGDKMVQEKQKSLRMGHVEGWAVFGGYDYRLVRAMGRREYVLTMKVVGGKAELFERMPSDPSEELLTDDGSEPVMDTVRDYFSGTGNDVLTLNPRIAQLLGVSKGTVESTEDLLVALGEDRNSVVIKDRGAKIMKQWAKSLDNAKSQFQTLFREYQEVQVEEPGDYDARTKARGLRKNKLLAMKALLKRYEEGLRIYSMVFGLPPISQIETAIKEIELEQSLDKKPPRRR